MSPSFTLLHVAQCTVAALCFGGSREYSFSAYLTNILRAANFSLEALDSIWGLGTHCTGNFLTEIKLWGACRLDDKIRKLDEQLMKHRDAIKKTRPGPAQDAAKRRALSVSPLCLR